MRSPNERQTGQFGRLILNQLSEKLSKHTKTRHQDDSDGSVGNFSDGVVNFTDGVANFNDDVVRSRKLTSKELQLLILALLANKPAHSFELIRALELRSNGSYSPSPGMIYPALTHLEELEHISVTFDGSRGSCKYYALSAAGQLFLTSQQHRVDAMWLKLIHVSGTMSPARSDECNEVGLPELIEAKTMLTNALNQCSNASLEEQRRIAEVLIQTAGTILGR